MSASPTSPVVTKQNERLHNIFQRLLPLLDSLGRKLKLTIVLGLLVTVWLLVWCIYVKRFSLVAGTVVGLVSFFPTLILCRFWWAIEELKKLPDIAGQMMGDAKTEFFDSAHRLSRGKTDDLGFLNLGKNLWSVSAMVLEARELMGSYVSISTLINPLMLGLGITSFVSVFVLFITGVTLVFFI